MKATVARKGFHLTVTPLFGALLMIGGVYPFLPGRYDPMAVPLSMMIQAFGAAGMPLVVIGVLWLLYPSRAYRFGWLSVAWGSVVAVIVALVGAISSGFALGGLVLAAGVCVIFLLVSRLGSLRQNSAGSFQPAGLERNSLAVEAIHETVAGEAFSQGFQYVIGREIPRHRRQLS